jgi:DNA-binding NarL/FixJ family response regulator
MEKPTIIIADNHSIYRMGLSGYLKLNGYSRIRDAANGEELRTCIEDCTGPVIVLFDIGLDDVKSTETMARILGENPGTRFIVLTEQAEAKCALQCVRIGAVGFINKSQPEKDILAAIEAVRAGITWFNPKTIRLMADSIHDGKVKEPALPHLKLSEKEYRVFLLLAGGSPNKEISHKLHLAETTVSTYKKHILQKLNVRSMTELGMYALRNKLP